MRARLQKHFQSIDRRIFYRDDLADLESIYQLGKVLRPTKHGSVIKIVTKSSLQTSFVFDQLKQYRVTLAPMEFVEVNH